MGCLKSFVVFVAFAVISVKYNRQVPSCGQQANIARAEFPKAFTSFTVSIKDFHIITCTSCALLKIKITDRETENHAAIVTGYGFCPSAIQIFRVVTGISWASDRTED